MMSYYINNKCLIIFVHIIYKINNLIFLSFDKGHQTSIIKTNERDLKKIKINTFLQLIGDLVFCILMNVHNLKIIFNTK